MYLKSTTALIFTLLLTGCMTNSSPIVVHDPAPEQGIKLNGLQSSGQGDCSSDAGPDAEFTLKEEKLLVWVPVAIDEWSTRQDQWTGVIDVEWSDSPGIPPEDGRHETTYSDVKGRHNSWDTWISLSWDSSELTSDGVYRFNVKVQIQHADKAWDSNEDFNTRCNRSDSANVVIHK